LPVSGVVTDYSGARGQMSGRRVAGQTRLFVMGNNGNGYKVVEVAPPASFQATAAAAISAGSGGRFSIVTDWGNIYNGAPSDYLLNSGGNVCDIITACHYQNGALYWSFFYSYNTADFNDRCLGASVLNDASPGSGQISAIYGPWRIGNTSKKVAGFFTKIPQAFADAHLGGKTFGMGATAQSGVNSSPYGGALYAFTVPTGSIAPSAYANQSDVAFSGTEVLLYSRDHAMPLPTLVRKNCFWNDPGNHSALTANISAGATSIPVADTSLFAQPTSLVGSLVEGIYGGYIGPTITDGSTMQFSYAARSTTSGPGNLTGIPASGLGSIPNSASSGTFVLLAKYDNGRGGTAYDSAPIWGPRSATGPFATDVGSYFDYCNGMCMITTSTNKSGLLFVGTLCDTIAGEDYGTDTVDHVFYGGHGTCPHGQTSPFFQSTGPASKTIVPHAWLHSFDDLVALLGGSKTIDQVTPVDFTRLSDISAFETVVSHQAGKVGGAWFDEATDRLYIMEANRDGTSAPGITEPLIHCWRLT
jgi:hypothetical protein